MKTRNTSCRRAHTESCVAARLGAMILVAGIAGAGGVAGGAATTQPAPVNENNCKLDCAQQLKQAPYNTSKPVEIGIPTVVNQTIDKLNSEFSNFNITGGSLNLKTAIAQITANQSYTCCSSTSCQTPVSDKSYSGGIGVTASANFRIPFTSGQLNLTIGGYGVDLGGSFGPDVLLSAGAKASTTLNCSSCGDSATVGIVLPISLTVTPAAFDVGAYVVWSKVDLIGFTLGASASGSTAANLNISVTAEKSGVTFVLGAALGGLTVNGDFKGGVTLPAPVGFVGLNQSYSAQLIKPVVFGDSGSL